MNALANLSVASVLLADRPLAAALYERLAPYASHNTPSGVIGFYEGVAARFLAGLAAFLGDAARAEQHFEAAVASASRWCSATWRSRCSPTARCGPISVRTSRGASFRRPTCSPARRDPELFRSKLVLVGVTGLGLLDFQVTPLGERVPGVEVHSQMIEQVFDGDFLVRPSWAPWLVEARPC